MSEIPEGAGEALPDHAQALMLERFRVLRVLKRGEGLDTRLGEDASTGAPVLMKTLPIDALDDRTRRRLELEAEALAPADGRLLAANIAHGETDGLFCVVRRFIPGVTLAERLEQGPLSVAEALAIGRGLMLALRAAHDRGVVHLDVKPSNLVLRDEVTLVDNLVLRDAEVTLVDFSLARRPPLDAPSLERPAGSYRYLAPETLGLIDREVADPADLYSAGILLYECLAGRPPFDGTIGEVLRLHVRGRPAGLRSAGVSLPRALQDMVERLLRKDPRDRYQSAEGVLADLKACADALARGVAEPGLVVGALDRRRQPTDPAFVGRQAELAALQEAVARAAHGRGELVYVEGESGAGKTRLLEELGRAVSQGVWIVSGPGMEPAPEQRLPMLSALVPALVSACQAKPELAERLRRRLGPQRAAVVDALPGLRSVLVAEASAETLGPEALGEVRSVRAVASLLEALGSDGAPAIVLLDDAQWADDFSLKVIQQWSRSEAHGAGARHVTMVLAFRADEVPSGHLLRAVSPTRTVSLPPLEGTDIARLVESMAGPMEEEVIGTVVRLSEGNPFMASLAVRGLIEEGAITVGTAGWTLAPGRSAEPQALGQAADMLVQRLRRLAPEGRGVLTAAAVLGREFELELTAPLAGVATHEALALLADARRRRLVWSRAEGRYAFVHQPVRQGFLDLLTAQERERLHRRAGELLERHDPSRVYELAQHFDAAGESRRAAPYAMAAAQQARAQHLLETAEDAFRIAERGFEEAGDATLLPVLLGLGDVLALRGRYADALDRYVRARSLATEPLTQARIESKVAEVAFKSSHYDTALKACNEALRLLGRKAPRGTLAFFLGFLGQVFVHILHAVFPGLFLARRQLGTPQAEADLLAVSIYDRLIYVWYFARAGKTPAGWACLRALNLAESYPPTFALGHGYSVLANVIAGGFPPLASWSLKLRAKALTVQEAMGDLYGRGQALVYCWPVSHAVLDFQEGIERARRGRKLLEVAGDQWDVNAAYWGIALCHYHRGDVDAAVAECEALYGLARAIGDHQNVANGLWVWAQASRGRMPRALVEEALELPGLFLSSRISLLGAKGLCLLAQDDPLAALEPLGEATDLAIGKRLVDTLIGDVLPWHAAALRMVAERLPLAAAGRRRQLLRMAHSRARLARLFGRVYPLIRPPALRQSGLVAAAMGQERHARRFLDAAAEVAERQGMRLEHALALQARGQTGRALGWEDAQADLAAAERELADLGAAPPAGPPMEPAEQPPTPALVERFATLLDKGIAVVTSLSKETALEAIRDAAQTLLRAERCVIVEVAAADGATTLTPAGPPDLDFPRGLIERAVSSREPVVYDADVAAEAEASLVRSGVKSALCAPVLVRGSVAACIYLEHRQLAGLFGREEERLVGFVATLAGAALENARSVAELEAAHRTISAELERQVAQRTAELQARNRELEDFSYSVSHDLRAPLRGMDGFSLALLEDYADRLDARGEDYLNRIRAAAHVMDQLIDGLLELSRVTRAELRRDRIDLSLLARGVVEELERGEPDRGVEAVVAHGLVAYGDARMVRVVLQNLLGNAWKFTRSVAHPRVELGSAPSQEEIAFFVRDNGVGFDMRYADKLFAPFQRLHPVGQFTGTGIGLATVQRIIARHGGRVWAESAPEAGATFWFTLPSTPEGDTP